MLTSNKDIADRLINGQLGVVFDFKQLEGAITKMHVKFDENLMMLKEKCCSNISKKQKKKQKKKQNKVTYKTI